MNLSSKFQTLLPKKRWQRILLEAGLIIAVIFGAQYFQTRGLPEGAAPPLEGIRTDGSQVKVPAGDPKVVQSKHSAGAGALHARDSASRASDTATLVVFWSTWCPVCKAEEGNIVSVAQDYRVVSVAMQSGDATTVTKHLKERGIDLPALIDADGRHAANWRVRGVPTHFVVDGAGNIRFRVVGYATTWGLKARLWWAETFPA
ncbi:MAG: redoxin domain-containing protein [Rhodocyclaceae bacterium]|nr:redoxin domain-containing protein [Rhodocyclaceae bacterium]